jgi:hypothetical protein
MSIDYRERRNLSRRGKPEGAKGRAGDQPTCLIQRHDASSLDYGVRLEIDGESGAGAKSTATDARKSPSRKRGA